MGQFSLLKVDQFWTIINIPMWKIRIRKKEIRVLLDPYDDAELQRDVEYACAKFNCSDVQTSEGQRCYINMAGEVQF